MAKLGKLIAYTSVEQEHAWENLGITISQVIKEDAGRQREGSGLAVHRREDHVGRANQVFDQCQLRRAWTSWTCRIGDARSCKDIDYFDMGGQTVFPISGASGGLASAFIFYFITGFQVWNDSPRSGSYIANLALPSGY